MAFMSLSNVPCTTIIYILLCPMHVSVYVFAHTYVSVHVCMCIHHVYNKVYSKSIYYHDNRKIDTVTQDYVQQSVLIHVQASRLARGTVLMMSRCTSYVLYTDERILFY